MKVQGLMIFLSKKIMNEITIKKLEYFLSFRVPRGME